MLRTTTSRVSQSRLVGFFSIAILLLVLALALTACGAATSGSGTGSTTGGATTSSTSTGQGNTSGSTGNGNSSTQQLQNADQQIQSVMQTLNGAATDAQNADNNSGDNNPQP